MKLQYLIIIFLLIMTPIYLVFSKYIDTQIDNLNLQYKYDLKLEDATYDAVKSFQKNTLSSVSYMPEDRVRYSRSAVSSFFTSLGLTFGFNGESENNSTLKEYVPAVVLTMYDGYYIYAPFVNRLTNVTINSENGGSGETTGEDGSEPEISDGDEHSVTVKRDFQDGRTITELKPYISYSCNYSKNNKDYIITYSLDNYIVVDEFGSGVENGHKRHEGYLIGLNQYTDITKNAEGKVTSFKFNGISFSAEKKERLQEYLAHKTSRNKGKTLLLYNKKWNKILLFRVKYNSSTYSRFVYILYR